MLQFQVSHASGYMRYANFYEAIPRLSLVPAAPRVLVFGCSTGQELNTVRFFMPDAQIFGCDITEAVVAEAQRTAPHAEVFLSTDEAIAARGPFDLVCANSVLCRHPFPAEPYCDVLPPADFERLLSLIVRNLAPGGLLLAYNCNYVIDDFDLAADLTPITLSSAWTGSFVPRVTLAGTVVARPTVREKELMRYVIDRDYFADGMGRLQTALFRNAPGPRRHLSVDTIAHHDFPPHQLTEAELAGVPGGDQYTYVRLEETVHGHRFTALVVYDPIVGAWVPWHASSRPVEPEPAARAAPTPSTPAATGMPG